MANGVAKKQKLAEQRRKKRVQARARAGSSGQNAPYQALPAGYGLA